jgi:prephenate dehydrogenase
MIPDIQELAEHDVSWLAIRHPAVMRLLDRELAAPDGDAFAAGLELADRILGGHAPMSELRLDHNTLNTGMVAVRSGRCDRAMVRSIREQIDALPVVLTPREHDAVATVIAAIIWSVLDASSRELDDTLVA